MTQCVINKSLLLSTLDGLRRLDPVWCKLHDREQITDEELDELIGEFEQACEELAPHG